MQSIYTVDVFYRGMVNPAVTSLYYSSGQTTFSECIYYTIILYEFSLFISVHTDTTLARVPCIHVPIY